MERLMVGFLACEVVVLRGSVDPCGIRSFFGSLKP